MPPNCFPVVALDEHRLLDSGDGEKLERFGQVVLRRPDPQALWRRRLPERIWDDAHLTFVRESDRGGHWRAARAAPSVAQGDGGGWPVGVLGARLLVRPTPFKHVGLFPEQASNWRFALDALAELDADRPRVLNLFGYTGAASVLTAQAGADVTHVDASKASLTWARENAVASGLGERALRLVCEDALEFVRRAARRGDRWEVVLLDPPHYGRGPKGQKWQLETGLAALLEASSACLAERGVLVVSMYAVGFSPLALANCLDEVRDGRVAAAELVLAEQGSERLLPCGFCGRLARGLDLALGLD